MFKCPKGQLATLLCRSYLLRLPLVFSAYLALTHIFHPSPLPERRPSKVTFPGLPIHPDNPSSTPPLHKNSSPIFNSNRLSQEEVSKHLFTQDGTLVSSSAVVNDPYFKYLDLTVQSLILLLFEYGFGLETQIGILKGQNRGMGVKIDYHIQSRPGITIQPRGLRKGWC